MFHHHKELAYTVRVDKPNPVFARMLQQAIGGPEGEMRVMNQYLFQAWGARGFSKYRDMTANVAAESIGRTLAARLRELTDDPGMKDMLSFLVARDTMHQQQWLAAIEELGTSGKAVPEDVLDEGDYQQYAYSFFGHADEPMDPSARWLSGSLDGEGAFSFADPAPRLGQEPQLAQAPQSVHAGLDATRTNGHSGGDGMMSKVKDAITGE